MTRRECGFCGRTMTEVGTAPCIGRETMRQRAQHDTACRAQLDRRGWGKDATPPAPLQPATEEGFRSAYT